MSDIVWTLEGRGITAHPSGGYALPYRKTATVLAVDTVMGGVVRTPEGDMAFEAGDYLVSDDPPTHLWPVKRAVFERTYAPERAYPASLTACPFCGIPGRVATADEGTSHFAPTILDADQLADAIREHVYSPSLRRCACGAMFDPDQQARHLAVVITRAVTP